MPRPSPRAPAPRSPAPARGSSSSPAARCGTTRRDRRVTARRRNAPYCSSSGRSSPRLRPQLGDVLRRCASPSIACAGSPGTRWISENTSVATPSSTGTVSSTRRTQIPQHARSFYIRVGDAHRLSRVSIDARAAPMQLAQALPRDAELARRHRGPAAGARQRGAHVALLELRGAPPPASRASSIAAARAMWPAAPCGPITPALRAGDHAPTPARSAVRARCPASRTTPSSDDRGRATAPRGCRCAAASTAQMCRTSGGRSSSRSRSGGMRDAQ